MELHRQHLEVVVAVAHLGLVQTAQLPLLALVVQAPHYLFLGRRLLMLAAAAGEEVLLGQLGAQAGLGAAVQAEQAVRQHLGLPDHQILAVVAVAAVV
jgi:hypothetical protein